MSFTVITHNSRTVNPDYEVKLSESRIMQKLVIGSLEKCGEGDVAANIDYISHRVKEAPIDVGVIGIGENGHIAFNDPPADFDTEAAYKVVTLDERCRKQQVGEGWFATIDDVPKQAISMCVKQIMSSRCIVTVVPHAVKAEAIKNTLAQDINNMVPATIMKSHPHWDLYLDADSAAGFLKL